MRTVEHNPAVTRRRRRPDRGVERHRIAPPAAAERKGEIGLVDVARCDRLLQGSEGVGIAAGRQLRLHRAERAARALGELQQALRHLHGGDRLIAVKCAEPHQRAMRAAAPGDQRGQPRFQREAGLIGDHAGKIAALAAERLDPLQRRLDFISPARDDCFHRRAVEPCVAGALAPGVVEQDEGFGHAGHLLAARGGSCKKPLAQIADRPYQVGDARSGVKQWTRFSSVWGPIRNDKC